MSGVAAASGSPAASRVTAAYAARAAEYADTLGSIEATHTEDRKLIAQWADGCRAAEPCGRIIDVGSGPGHWTDFLSRRGHTVSGIEPVSAFIDSAQRRFPTAEFCPGDVLDLPVGDRSVSGALAWYSLIHLPPADLPLALAQLHRVLSPGGSLLLGFFAGPTLSMFDHAVAPAWFWPVERLAAHLGDAGFSVDRTLTRQDPGARLHGALVARRAAERAPAPTAE